MHCAGCTLICMLRISGDMRCSAKTLQFLTRNMLPCRCNAFNDKDERRSGLLAHGYSQEVVL